ncbi:hypothetical protein DENSPDRAFT_58857 [Dentipellis sp. KUC8613]|nr:hypothetical protein DENSPDRAFT_58857 [Dentipellis sp. KUC8613]
MTLENTMGAILVGLVLNATLYGMVCVQTYQFLENFGKSDRLYLRLLVMLLWALDTLQLVLTLHAAFYFLIFNFDQPSALSFSVWSLNLETSVSTTITFIVRSFFAARVWQLSDRNKPLFFVTFLLSFAQFGMGFYLTVLCFIEKNFDKLPLYMVPVCVQSVISIGTDMMISAPLIYYLRKSMTGRKRTNSVINLLIIWSINTALTIGVNEILQLIMWMIMPTNLIWTVFHLLTAKLYTNSMLAMLNGRGKVREELNRPITHTSIFAAAENGRSPSTGIVFHIPSQASATAV